MGYSYGSPPFNGNYEFPHSVNFDSSLRDVIEKIERLQKSINSFSAWAQAIDYNNGQLVKQLQSMTENAVRECKNTLSWYMGYTKQLDDAYKNTVRQYQQATEKLIHSYAHNDKKWHKMLWYSLERWKKQEEELFNSKIKGVNARIDSAQIYTDTIFKALKEWVETENKSLAYRTQGQYEYLQSYINTETAKLSNTDWGLQQDILGLRREIVISLSDLQKKIADIDEEIAKLNWELPDVYNPVIKQKTTLQQALNDMWHVFSHYGALTTRQYRAYAFTTQQYRNFAIGFTQYKGIPVWFYRAYSRFFFFHYFALTMFSPVTGSRVSLKTAINQVYNTINPRRITAKEYSDCAVTTAEYRNLDITTLMYSADYYNTLVKLQSIHGNN